ncbi:MAG TPA: protein-disulfide reductase DsbD family protein [Chitinophagales bacterium]|nr:protein-disulfide reductase DsbD family protein [Chitinophagales bacterium]
MKSIFSLIFALFLSFTLLKAQHVNPVSWEISSQELGNNEFLLSFDAKIEKGWYVYSQHIKNTPPMPTGISFKQTPDFEQKGIIDEFGKLLNEFDPIFEKEIKKYANKVSFQARVKTHKPQTKITGYIEYMACDKSKCLPPSKQSFTFNLISTDFDTFFAQENTSPGKFEVIKSKRMGAEEYTASDMEINLGKPNPVNLDETGESGGLRATAARKKSGTEYGKEDFFNGDKLINLDNMTGDLLVAANLKKLTRKTESKPNKKSKKVLAQNTPKKQELPKPASQPFINPVNWSFNLYPIQGDIYEIVLSATIQDQWYVYSQNNSGSAPFPAQISFDDNAGITFLDEETAEIGTLLNETDPIFEKKVNRYAGTVTYKRKVQFLQNVRITGAVKYMAATNKQYLMPKEVHFALNNSLMIPVAAQQKATVVPAPLSSPTHNSPIWMGISFALVIGLLVFVRKATV